MTSQRWDPYRVLALTSPQSTTMFCVGRSVFGTRCGCIISNGSFLKARSILDTLGIHPPEEALEDLRDLAHLCVCETYHRNQAYVIKDGWSSLIKVISEGHRSTEVLKEQNQLLKVKYEKEIGKRKQLESLLASTEELQKRYRDAEEVRFQLGVVQDTASSRKQPRNGTSAAWKDLLGEVRMLRSKVANVRKISAEHQEALAEVSKKNGALVIRSIGLQSQLVVEQQMSDSLRNDLDKKMKTEDDLLKQIRSLQVELSNERQGSNEMGDLGCEVEQHQIALKKSIQSLILGSAVPFPRNEELYREYNNLMEHVRVLNTQLCDDQNVLKATQLELEENREALQACKSVATIKKEVLPAPTSSTQTVVDNARLEVQNNCDALDKQNSAAEVLLAQLSDKQAELEITQIELDRTHKSKEQQQDAATRRETELVNQISGIQTTLYRTLDELEEARKESDKQKRIAAGKYAVAAEEKKKLHRRVNELECQLSVTLWGVFLGVVKTLWGQMMHWLMGLKLQRCLLRRPPTNENVV